MDIKRAYIWTVCLAVLVQCQAGKVRRKGGDGHHHCQDGGGGCSLMTGGCDCAKDSNCHCQHGHCESLGHDRNACFCNHGYTGETCAVAPTVATTTTTTPVPTTPTTTTPVPTTPAQINFHSCDRTSTTDHLAKHLASSDPLAAPCPGTNLHETHEAFTFDHCRDLSKDTSTWRPGLNVGAHCDQVPLFTAIAAFPDHSYSYNTSMSGVLVQCLQDGFQIAVQRCGLGPTIMLMSKFGFQFLNASIYYTIN